MDEPTTLGTRTDTSGTTEEVLAEIWKDLFEVTEVKPTDDFFGLGGTSLVAVMFLHRVEERFGPDALEPETLYENAQLSYLASVIDARGGSSPQDRPA